MSVSCLSVSCMTLAAQKCGKQSQALVPSARQAQVCGVHVCMRLHTCILKQRVRLAAVSLSVSQRCVLAVPLSL